MDPEVNFQPRQRQVQEYAIYNPKFSDFNPLFPLDPRTGQAIGLRPPSRENPPILAYWRQNLYPLRSELAKKAGAVGRLYVEFNNTRITLPMFGTAFFVAPNILATAAHNIRESDGYFPMKMSFSPHIFSSEELYKDESLPECKPLFGFKAPKAAAQDVDPISKVAHKTPSDFAFIQVRPFFFLRHHPVSLISLLFRLNMNQQSF